MSRTTISVCAMVMFGIGEEEVGERNDGGTEGGR